MLLEASLLLSHLGQNSKTLRSTYQYKSAERSAILYAISAVGIDKVTFYEEFSKLIGKRLTPEKAIMTGYDDWTFDLSGLKIAIGIEGGKVALVSVRSKSESGAIGNISGLRVDEIIWPKGSTGGYPQGEVERCIQALRAKAIKDPFATAYYCHWVVKAPCGGGLEVRFRYMFPLLSGVKSSVAFNPATNQEELAWKWDESYMGRGQVTTNSAPVRIMAARNEWWKAAEIEGRKMTVYGSSLHWATESQLWFAGSPMKDFPPGALKLQIGS